MTPFVAEFFGSTLLITIGQGVVSNVVLPKTKGNGGGVLAICFGWAMAVFIALYITAPISGGHLNPAITIALAILGKFEWSLVPSYIAAQLLGAMLGSFLAWVLYRQHFNESTNPDDQLACFATSPGIKSNFHSIFSEAIGTFVLVLACLMRTKGDSGLGSLDALPVALIILAIGLGLGGVTGWAINPSRDLGPRIMHALLPIKGKGASNWGYSWIPVVGPILGAILAAWVYQAL
jgi:glycerol uptake facilitator protein